MKSFLKIGFSVFILVLTSACKTTYTPVVNNTINTSSSTYVNNPEGIDISNDEASTLKWNPKTPYNIEEFRAAWIATVANINWPSKPGLSSEEQQKEALELLDFLESHHYNAAIFQVRPQADALYKSEIEPWSYYLTGKQGLAPSPYYDPLLFWIDEAHKRGIELHVWLNPYRAHHSQGKEISEQSIVKTHPELVVKLENEMWWMDPALDKTKEHSLKVVKDIVSRYDIDGIHFDDYFYPYESYNNGKDFPDDKSWNQYLNSGGKVTRNDWRRENVNSFIKMVYQAIKEEKPYVKFGISPFGIWRPGYPASVVGFDQYNKLYADAKLWLNKGWIDYFSPQLYWKINKEGQRFPELLTWWQEENSKNRHLWPGIKVDYGGDLENVNEIDNQINITRNILPKSKGSIHWSIGPLLKYDSLAVGILTHSYAKKALVPPSPWLDNTPPAKPIVNAVVKENKVAIIWDHPNKNDVSKYVLYYQYSNQNWNHIILNSETTSYTLPFIDNQNNTLNKIGITAVDTNENQSLFTEEKLP